MPQLVKIRMRKPLRVYQFFSKDLPIERDEMCVVKTDRGLEYGRCVTPPEESAEDELKKFPHNVVRIATPHDNTTITQIREDEQRARRRCIEKIKQRKMDMKLVECEYSFDRKKIIFYFTADDRVDFRELVKDLAQEFKARIELRHIQVRDEAKIVGGIGTCGRELCCTTWMKEFMPISMKMAKRQNLSLNPSKISGQCGRLMCCLSYENDQYDRARRQQSKAAPKAEDLADIRDKMENNSEKAAEKLSDRTQSSGNKNRRRRRGGKGGGQSEGAPKGDAPKKEAGNAPQKNDGADSPNNNEGTGDAPKKRRRRRRRNN